MIQKNLTFNDFQRVLNEANGRPVWEATTDRFILEWLGGSFLYHTEVLFDDLSASYQRQFKKRDDNEAIKLFKEKYLVDAYHNLAMLPRGQEIPLMKSVFPVKEKAGKWNYEIIDLKRKFNDFKPKSLEMARVDNKLVVTGILKNGKKADYLVLEKK